MEHLYRIRSYQSYQLPYQASEETYKEALRLLESNENEELITIEKRFFERQHYISEQLFSARKAKDELVAKMRKNELEALYDAYKVVRAKKHYILEGTQGKEIVGGSSATQSMSSALKM